MGFFSKSKDTGGAPQFPEKLSSEFSGALRTFSFWIANGTVGLPLLEGIDYRPELFASPSLMEQAYFEHGYSGTLAAEITVEKAVTVKDSTVPG